MYDILKLAKLESELAGKMRAHFVEFFESHDYSKDSRSVVSYKVSSRSDVDEIYYSAGFYVILTDYYADINSCTLEVNGLKAIYRGHCCTVKKRMHSHLLNTDYRKTLREKGVRYDVCMKLDGENGINIIEDPYARFDWRVVVHKMNGSSSFMRKQGEWAFDEVFSRPLGSKEHVGK